MLQFCANLFFVIPAKAGIQKRIKNWMPIFIGMTVFFLSSHAVNAEEKSFFKLIDTIEEKSFDCQNIKSSVQEAACKGGLTQSNIDLQSDIKMLSSLLDKDGLALFKRSQAEWYAARNSNCEFNSYGLQGTQKTSTFIACIVNENKKRHQFLQDDISSRKD